MNTFTENSQKEVIYGGVDTTWLVIRKGSNGDDDMTKPTEKSNQWDPPA
jgi:hypothetical protein